MNISTISALALLAAVAVTSPAFAQDKAPLILSDTQMDSVTAGFTLTADLSATATGTTALTSTNGAMHLGTANILLVDDNPKTGLKLTGQSDAAIGFGGGEAVAQGADASCTAKTILVGAIAYRDQIAAATTTPTSAICTCAALAISLIPH